MLRQNGSALAYESVPSDIDGELKADANSRAHISGWR